MTTKSGGKCAFLPGIVTLALCVTIAALAAAQTGPSDRIAGKIDSRVRAPLVQGIHHLAQPSYDQGPVAGDFQLERITLQFKLSAAQQQDLDQLLQQLSDPASPNFHRWLTPEQFGERFGASANDLNKLRAWLEGSGLKVEEIPAGRTRVICSGTAAAVAAALQTEIHQYLVEGKSHYANATAISVPAALSNIVQSVHGLHDFRLKPTRLLRRAASPNYTYSSSEHFLAPNDIAAIYNLTGLISSGITGSGQKIAIAGQSNLHLTDVEAFRSAGGLTANDPTLLLIPGSKNPGYVSGDIDEASLDVEWSGAAAPLATIIFVYSTDVNNSLQYAVDNNVAPVISISYGECEAQATADGSASLISSLGSQANSQGQTIMAASGDAGAADCDTNGPATHGLAVDVPASEPSITGVGGTEFTEGTGSYWNSTNNSSNGSAKSYIPEEAWNDSTTNSLSATGGGKSTLYSKPLWQAGTGVPADGMRDVPDVSLSASADHDGYLVCLEGSCGSGATGSYSAAVSANSIYGGTSVSTPIFAGIMALINQKTGTTQGNANPILYSLAATSPSAFHDITAGNNIVSCRSGSTNCTSGKLGYSATTGYDQATGLGSMDATALATAWASYLSTAAAPTVTTVAASSVTTTGATLNGTVNPSGALASYWFEWGTSSSLSAYTATSTATLTGSTAQSVSATLSSLSGSATYYYRVAAYNPSGTVRGSILNFTAGSLAAQTITFPNPGTQTYGVGTITLTATASSGLAVTYSVTSGPATVSGSTLTITGAGSVTVQASQAGNSTYAAATPVSVTFTVNQEPQTIAFPNPGTQTYGAGAVTLAATASSGLAVTYSVTSGPATVSGSTLTITGAGLVTVQASQAGNTNYLAATPVSVTFTVNQASQTITFPNPGTQIEGASVTLTATASSGLAVTYSVTSGPATLSGNTLTITGAGSVSVQAAQAGNANYLAAPPVSQSFTVQDFSLPGTTPSVTVVAGGTTSTAVTVSAVNGLQGTVTFTCTTPANMAEASCSATSVTLTSTQTSGTSTVTVTTTAAHQVTAQSSGGKSTAAGLGAVLASMAFLGIPGVRRKGSSLLLLLLVLASLLTVVGCGGGGGGGSSTNTYTDPGTPAGTYTLTLTAKSGTATHTMNASVTVQ
jgi:subtilase family serine protease